MTPEQKILIQSILSRYLSLWEYKAFLFGSRAKGTAREWSDFDIGIQGSQPLSLDQKLNILTDFDDTPYRVDIVDFFTAKEWFKKIALQYIIYL